MRKHATATTNMFEQAASPTVFRVWLYEVDAPGGTLYYAQSRQNVEYGGNTYIAAPVKHDGISENTTGKIDTLTIKVGNLNRDINALLELHNGLKGCRVRVLQVMNLSDPNAYIEDFYWVDQVDVKDGQGARFVLSSRMDIMDAMIAPRKYARYFCHATFQGRGCWGWFGCRLKTARAAAGFTVASFAARLGVTETSVHNWETSRYWPGPTNQAAIAAALGVEASTIFHTGYTARPGFVLGDPATCDHTLTDCKRHGNEKWFVAFPGVPTDRVVRA